VGNESGIFFCVKGWVKKKGAPYPTTDQCTSQSSSRSRSLRRCLKKGVPENTTCDRNDGPKGRTKRDNYMQLQAMKRSNFCLCRNTGHVEGEKSPRAHNLKRKVNLTVQVAIETRKV